MTPQPALQELGFDECARDLLRDLHAPAPKIFWADLSATALVAWGAFSAAVLLDSLCRSLRAVVAGLAMYRGVCFIHELTHLRPRALPGFETAWNLLFGVPLFLPSFMYVGVHQDHHRISTYGTPRDPEYMPFARSNIMMLVFVAHSILLPIFLFLRFVIVSPVALLFPPLHRWLAVHASALSMNLAYRRHVGVRAGEHDANLGDRDSCDLGSTAGGHVCAVCSRGAYFSSGILFPRPPASSTRFARWARTITRAPENRWIVPVNCSTPSIRLEPCGPNYGRLLGCATMLCITTFPAFLITISAKRIVG